MDIPEDYIDFLHWVKKRTEEFWSKDLKNSNDDFVCEDWAYGAKWIGLKESEIDSIEKKYDIQFAPDHRAFLKILHTIDRKKVYTYDPYEEGKEIEYEEVPFFYNWKLDDEEINEYLNWPYTTMFQDVIGPNKVWLKSWGEIRPASDTDKEFIFRQWFDKAPKLIPINIHRFVVGAPVEDISPVLSIWGTDTIVYGWNMRHYLLNELKEHLGLLELVYDKEDNQWYSEYIKEFQDINNYEYGKAKNKVIPVLEEMILYWSSGWSSYGKEYPNPNNETIRPIVKTFIPEDESKENIQKTCNSFENLDHNNDNCDTV